VHASLGGQQRLALRKSAVLAQSVIAHASSLCHRCHTSAGRSEVRSGQAGTSRHHACIQNTGTQVHWPVWHGQSCCAGKWRPARHHICSAWRALWSGGLDVMGQPLHQRAGLAAESALDWRGTWKPVAPTAAHDRQADERASAHASGGEDERLAPARGRRAGASAARRWPLRRSRHQRGAPHTRNHRGSVPAEVPGRPLLSQRWPGEYDSSPDT
jgi:hypothetical protein